MKRIRQIYSASITHGHVESFTATPIALNTGMLEEVLSASICHHRVSVHHETMLQFNHWFLCLMFVSFARHGSDWRKMARTIMLLAARRSCKGGMTIPEGLLDIHLMITQVAGCSQQFAWFAAFCQFSCCCLWHAVLINFLQCSACQTWNMALVRLEGSEGKYISKLNKCDFVMKNHPRSSVFHVVSRRINFHVISPSPPYHQHRTVVHNLLLYWRAQFNAYFPLLQEPTKWSEE